MSQTGSWTKDDPVLAAPRRNTRRRFLETSWILGVVGFTVARLLVAQETLAQYGLNIWIFGVIDLVTAVPYAVGVARVVGAVVDRQARVAGWWLVIAVASFLAPYVYVAVAGRNGSFPVEVYLVLAAVMVIFGANAVWNCVRKVRRARIAGIAGRE